MFFSANDLLEMKAQRQHIHHTSYIKIVFQEPPMKTESEVREIAETLVAGATKTPSNCSNSQAPQLDPAHLVTIGGLALIHIA